MKELCWAESFRPARTAGYRPPPGGCLTPYDVAVSRVALNWFPFHFQALDTNSAYFDQGNIGARVFLCDSLRGYFRSEVHGDIAVRTSLKEGGA